MYVHISESLSADFTDMKNVHFLRLEPRETVKKCPEIVLKFSKNWVLKFHFLLLGALLYCSVTETCV